MTSFYHRIRQMIPSRKRLSNMRWFGPIFRRDALWTFNKYSVARGVALGLFIAPLLPLGHMFLAGFFAFPLRANVLAAILSTWVINPITMVPFYALAYRSGAWLINSSTTVAHNSEIYPATLIGWLAWMLDASLPTALGAVVFAVMMSVIGYGLVLIIWPIRQRLLKVLQGV